MATTIFNAFDPNLVQNAGAYLFATSTTMADPSTGNVRFNNATIASVTGIAISATGTNSDANYQKLKQLQAGDTLTIFDTTTTTKWLRCLVASTPTDNTTWFQISVSYIASGSGGLPASTDGLTVLFGYASTSGVVRVVSGTGAPATSLGSNGDFAFNDNSQVYYKSGGAWAISGRQTAFVPSFVANGWTTTNPGGMNAPATSTSAWTKTNLAAQSGSAINFASSSADASAKIVLPPQARAINGYFTLVTLPVGGPMSFGLGVYPAAAVPGTAPWPLINVSTAGVVTVTTGNGITIKTLSGTAATNDVFAISMRPGAVLIGWSDSGFGLKDQLLFASTFVSISNLQTFGAQAWIFGTGTLTAGNINYNGGLEAVL